MNRLSPLLLLVAVATSATIESPDAPLADNTQSWKGHVMCTTPESCLQYWESVKSKYDKLFGTGDDDSDNKESLAFDSQDRDTDNRDSSFSSITSEESDQLKMRSSDNDDENNSYDYDLYIDDYNTDNNGEGGKENEVTHSNIIPNKPSVENTTGHRNIRSLDKYTHGFDNTNDKNDNYKFGGSRFGHHGGFRRVHPSSHAKWHVHKGRGVQQIVDWKQRRGWKIQTRPFRKVNCTRKPRPIWITRNTKAPTSKPCIKYSSWLRVCIRWGTTTASTGFSTTTTKPTPVVQFTSTPKGKESTQSSSVPTEGQSTQSSTVPTEEQSTQFSSVPTEEQSTQSSSVPTKEQSTSTIASTTVESTTFDFNFSPVIT